MSIFNNEKIIIDNFIAENDYIVDIGGNIGEWSREVVNKHKNIFLDIYEPNENLIKKLKEIKKLNKFTNINNFAISDKNKELDFYIYDIHELSTLRRRDGKIEHNFNLGIPRKVKIKSYTLDDLYEKNIFIDFVKIDTEGSEIDVLNGMKNLINNNQIKTIQIEYGGTFLENNIKLEDIFNALKDYKFIYKLPENSDIIKIEKFDEKLEDYLYCNYIFSKIKGIC